jgi:hypothetical protein
MPCRLRVVLRNGQELVAECLYPPGHSSQTGLNEDVVTAKFRIVSRAMLAPEICEQVIDAALGLDAAGSISKLMTLVAAANTAKRAALRSPKLRERATP